MKKALLVASREYADNARTKGFWIGILAFPVLLVISIQVPQFLEKNATPVRNFILVDRSGSLDEVMDNELTRLHQRQIFQALASYGRTHLKFPSNGSSIDLERIPAGGLSDLISKFADQNPDVLDQFIANGGARAALLAMDGMLVDGAPEFVEPRVKFRRVSLPDEVDKSLSGRNLANALAPWLKGERLLKIDGQEENLFAFIEIPEDVWATDSGALPSWSNQKGSGRVQYWATNLADSDLRSLVEKALNRELHEQQFQELGVDVKAVREIQRKSVAVVSLDPRKEEGEEAVSMADEMRQYAPIGFVYFLWIAIMQVASMLLNNTVEEKSNRIIEVLLSSVTPWELMIGKLLGIAGIGLTLITAWILSLIGVLAIWAGPEAEMATQLLEVVLGYGLLASFALYFVLGYFLYAAIFLAMGSVCNTLKEAQNLMGPMMMIMIVPLLTMMFIPKDPNGALATFLSWVPIYTPFVMMNRAAADPPLFDVIGTTILLLVTNGAMLWFCGRIFRVGILRTGQPPKIKELFRWLKSE